MREYPIGWKTVKLDVVAEFFNGKPLEGQVIPDGNSSLITLDSINIKGQLKKNHKKISADGDFLKAGDIVSVLSDIAHGYLLGLSAVIPADDHYVLNQRMGLLRTRSEIDPNYLRSFINFNQSYFRERGQGTSQRHIYKRDFYDFDFSYPPLTEQKAIAKALSDIDELIAVTAQLLKKKERVFEGALRTEFSKSSGATLTTVSEICEVTKGSAGKYDKDFVQGSFGFLNGGINFSGSTEFANDSGDTVVISEGGNSCGFVNYIPKAFWCGGHAYRLIGFKGKQKYLYYALKKSEVEIMNLRVGSGLPNVQKKDLSNFMTPIHQSSKKQEEVLKFLDSLTSEIDYLKAELVKHECIKQGMAHDLLTGKVRLA